MRRFSAASCVLVAALISGSALLGQPSTPARNIDRARLDRVLGTSNASPLKVVRRTGIQDVRPSAPMVNVVAGDFIFRKVDSVAVREGGRSPASGERKIYQLPYRWFTVDSGGVERLLIPRLIVHGNGLTYDPATRIFRGTAMIGVEDSLHPGEGPQPLTRPLRIQLTLTGPGQIVPSTLAIAHTSLDYDSIAISARDSVNIRIRTAADPTGVMIPVQVYRPTIELSVLPSVLQGFGLGAATVSVALPPGYSRTDTITVRFSSRTLNVRPALLRVTADGANEAKLRSGSLGRHAIGADVDGMQADSIDVTVVRPWAFLSAVLVGLIVGGAATFFGSRPGKPTNIGMAILRGAPFGFLTPVALVLGVDWVSLHLDDPGTWMGVMLAAALGAYAGERILERATSGSPAPARPG